MCRPQRCQESDDAGSRSAAREAGYTECVAVGAPFHGTGTGLIALATPPKVVLPHRNLWTNVLLSADPPQPPRAGLQLTRSCLPLPALPWAGGSCPAWVSARTRA